METQPLPKHWPLPSWDPAWCGSSGLRAFVFYSQWNLACSPQKAVRKDVVPASFILFKYFQPTVAYLITRRSRVVLHPHIPRHLSVFVAYFSVWENMWLQALCGPSRNTLPLRYGKCLNTNMEEIPVYPEGKLIEADWIIINVLCSLVLMRQK